MLKEARQEGQERKHGREETGAGASVGVSEMREGVGGDRIRTGIGNDGREMEESTCMKNGNEGKEPSDRKKVITQRRRRRDKQHDARKGDEVNEASKEERGRSTETRLDERR